MGSGTDGHSIIQKHVSGVLKDPRINYLTEEFPLVETKRFDPQMKFVLNIMGYEVMGFLDGENQQLKKFLEIKLSGGLDGKDPTPWTLGKFRDLMQRKIYTLARPDYKKSTLITGSLDPDHWAKPMTHLKVIQCDNTEQDKKEALAWLEAGITVFESGDYNGGLDEDGRCTMGRMCPWGDACQFKRV